MRLHTASGSGTVASSKGTTAGTLNITIKWVKNHGTTKANIKFGPAVGPGKCALGSTRLKVTGKVTGGSGSALKYIKKGQPVTASVCLTASGSASAEPGTRFKF